MIKRLFFLLPAVALALSACGTLEVTVAQAPVTAAAPTQTAGPLAPAETPSLHWKSVEYENLYSFEYPQELYSIRSGNDAPHLDALWPGVVELSPNDNFNDVLGQPLSQMYRIRVAVQENHANLSMDDPVGLMSGRGGMLIQYATSLVDRDRIHPFQFGEQAALRVDDLPVGQAGTATQIMTIFNGKIYQWLIEPVQTSGDTRNQRYVEEILATFKLK